MQDKKDVCPDEDSCYSYRYNLNRERGLNSFPSLSRCDVLIAGFLFLGVNKIYRDTLIGINNFHSLVIFRMDNVYALFF